jgi:acetyl-CoA C-acetyltransferase/acetyl-CoA acyltransferase
MNQSNRLVIVDGVRTPFCKAGTDLAGFGADELGRIAVNALLTRTGLDPALVDEVIFGCVAQPVDAANVARVIALRAGIPQSVPALTVQRNCASGCEALTLAQEKMRAGCGSVFIVGGAESMSNIPLLFNQAAAAKFGRLGRARSFGQRLQSLASFRPSDFKPRIGLLLGLSDPVCGMNMGETAEILAREFGIRRDAQDEAALRSHQRALAAREKLAEEICPAFLPSKAGALTQDNGPRENQSLPALAKLKPVFERKTGTVTAGNASQVSDGAVALLVMSEKRAQELGFTPLGVLTGYAVAGCDPARMGLGPVFAMARAEEQTGLKPADADLIELNEAFAAQTLAVIKAARSEKFARQYLHRDTLVGELSEDQLNVNGGAIALGHPVGATGSRLVLTSLMELQRRKASRALVTMCVGGGQAAALWLERN